MKIEDCRPGMIVRSVKNTTYKGTYQILSVEAEFGEVTVETNNLERNAFSHVPPDCLEEVK